MDRNSAYTDLLQRHRNTVWRLCLQRSRGDMERCRDLMQEVCIALWLHFDQLRPDATPHEERAWVCWQCRSTLDLLRRKEHLTLYPLSDDIAESLPADNTDGQREEEDEFLAALNADERQIMRWQMEGYHADEIADLMGIGRNAVYQRMHRAVAKMRRVALLLLALLAASAVAVAVVPPLRQFFFGSDEPVDTTLEEPAPMPVDTVAVDSVAPPAHRPKSRPRPRREPMEHLQGMSDESTEELPTVEDMPTVSITGNVMVVSGVYGERVSVYSYNGTLLASQMCNGICTFRILPDGDFFGNNYLRYTVRIGNRPEIFVSL